MLGQAGEGSLKIFGDPGTCQFNLWSFLVPLFKKKPVMIAVCTLQIMIQLGGPENVLERIFVLSSVVTVIKCARSGFV